MARIDIVSGAKARGRTVSTARYGPALVIARWVQKIQVRLVSGNSKIRKRRAAKSVKEPVSLAVGRPY